MKQIWFIRHGQSTSNAGLPTADPGSTPLTEMGKAQAKAVAAYFTEAPQLIVTSPYMRTQQTAAPTLAKFPGVRQEEWAVQEFTYLAPSKYVDTTMDDRMPHVVDYWQRAQHDWIDGEGAESFLDLMGRVDGMLAQLAAEEAQSIAVFTHGIFIRALLWRWLTGSTERAVKHMAGFRPFLLSVPTRNGSIIEGEMLPNGKLFLGPIVVEHIAQELRTW